MMAAETIKPPSPSPSPMHDTTSKGPNRVTEIYCYSLIPMHKDEADQPATAAASCPQLANSTKYISIKGK